MVYRLPLIITVNRAYINMFMRNKYDKPRRVIIAYSIMYVGNNVRNRLQNGDGYNVKKIGKIWCFRGI